MPALLLRPTPGREGDSALVRVLEASIETLRAENEILRRRLADAEARVARETANAEQAIAEFSAITKRLRARAQRLAG
jgi:inorganic triphosphatase YgiF